MAERPQKSVIPNRAAKAALVVWLNRIASNAQRLREARGLTQEAAAERCQLEPRHLQAIEAASANVTVDTLARLCAGFAIDPLDLLADAPPPKKRPPGRPKTPTAKKSS